DSAEAVRSGVLGPETASNRVNGKQVTQLSSDRFYKLHAPIAGLYALRPGADAIRIETLPQREAFVAICKAAFNGEVTEAGRLKEHFNMASRMASSVPVKRLSIPRSLATLPSVCDAVLKDVRESVHYV